MKKNPWFYGIHIVMISKTLSCTAYALQEVVHV